MGLEVEVVGETNKFDVIVIGGGVAGMTASSLVTQAGLKSCFLEKDVPGGKLMHIGTVHNFMGGDVPGDALGQQLFRQATEEIKTNYVFGNVQSIKPKNDLFYLFTEDGQAWEAKAIIVATGTITNKLDVDNEDIYFGHGISYCINCDASLAKDKVVALIGNKNELAKLQSIAKEVKTYKVSDIQGFAGDGNRIIGVITGNGTELCDHVFIDNGFKPGTDFLPSEIVLDDKKQVIVDSSMASPHFQGVFACGDCINSQIKMIQPAIEQAKIAAESAVKYVKSKHW